MKANKALKRIAKIEALVTDVTQRFSAGAPLLSGVLKDLKVAVARVKEAVSAQVSSRAATKEAAPARKKAAKKRIAPKAKTVKKRARIKRSVKRAAAKRAAPTSGPAEIGGQEPTPAIDPLP